MKLPVPSDRSLLSPAKRWADVRQTYGHANPERARKVADKLTAFGVASVLDIGCGDMKLGEFLDQAGIRYVPADVVSRRADCLVVNLDTDEVPVVEVECAVLTGVVEFLADPVGVLRDIAGKYARLLVTLSPLQTIYDQVWPGKPHTLLCRHANAFGLNEFKKILAENFVIEDVDVMFNGQYLLLARSRSAGATKAAAGEGHPAVQQRQAGIEDNNIDFGVLADGFEEHIFKSVPFHSMFLRTTVLLGTAVARPGTVCVDVGCSTGRLARSLRRGLRETVPVEIVGVDSAAEMIAEARRKDGHPLTRYVRSEIEVFDFPVSVFVSCLFTLQFLDYETRRSVLRRIFQSLEWRGCVVVAEKVVDQDGPRQMSNHYLLNAYKHAMGFTDEEILAKERAVRAALRPLTREENMRLFEEAGFGRVQVVAAVFGWELYLLEKR